MLETVAIAMLACGVASAGASESAAPQDAPWFKAMMVCPEDGTYPFSHGSTLVEFPDGRLLCAWYAGSREKGDDVAIVGAELGPNDKEWSASRTLVDTPGKSEGNPVLFLNDDGVLWLFYQTMYGSGDGRTQQGTGWTTCKVKAITSTDKGKTWSEERILVDELGYLTRNKPAVLKNGTILLPIQDERNWSSRVLISADKGKTWEMSASIDCGLGFHNGNIEPALLEREDGSVLCYMRTGSERYRTWQSVSTDRGRTWSVPVETGIPNPNAALDLLRLESGHVLMALNPVPEGNREKLSVWLSIDEANRWPIRRDVPPAPGYSSYPALLLGHDGSIHMTCSRPNGGIKHMKFNEAWVWEDSLVSADFTLANVVPPLEDGDDPRTAFRRKPRELPIPVQPFEVHVRNRDVGDIPPMELPTGEIDGAPINAVVQAGDTTWIGTDRGLYSRVGSEAQRHESYGIDGPLATTITALAVDARGTLWIGTPMGLTLKKSDGTWEHIRGREGLPYEDITALAFDSLERLWIGTTHGAIQYRPFAEGRQWFYRAGQRYLPDDHVLGIAVSPDGKTAYFATKGGPGRIDEVTKTLLGKADAIEALVNTRHRRFGLVAQCHLDDAVTPTSHSIDDNDNDGLWTAYHVTAMSLCYAVTGDEAARESAKESMHAMILLQNASGVPGLVARSVVSAEEGKSKGNQWRPTPDGKLYWKSDTSSDEIDGHYMALYAYWEHIAQFIPGERTLIAKQVRDLTDYIVDNGYVLLDWDGERTRWGFWSPELLNGDPEHYLENGLNSLQMLSFLKVAHHVTGDNKYKREYDHLIGEHGYLSNILLEKKLFPDENNHSDNQLAYTAWYPILQLEWDPRVRIALRKAVRRHYATLARDGSSYFYLVTATIDPDYVDIEGAIRNLQEFPEDRRRWAMKNSHRSDIVWDPRIDRFGKRQLLHVLPCDERDIGKWNGNVYVPDVGGSGQEEDDGSSYLLPYWIGRYHGLFDEADGA